MPSSRSSAARKIETGFVDAEYIPPRELPKPRKLRAAEKPAGAEKQRIEDEDRDKLEEIQTRLHMPEVRLLARSDIERKAAHGLIEKFRAYLEERDGITDRGMDAYGHQMQEVSEHLHALQAEAHRLNAGETVAEMMGQNFKVLEELETALRASKMEPARARAEMRFGTKVRQYEKEQEWHGEGAEMSAKTLENQIRDQYGLHPEELMAGGGWQGVKFRFKNALAHVVGRKSFYDEWRAAKSLEEASETANLSRKAHEQQMVTELSDSDIELVEEAPPSSRRRKNRIAPENDNEPALENSGKFEIPKERRRAKKAETEGVVEISEADRKRIIRQLDQEKELEEIDRGWELSPEAKSKLKKKKEDAEGIIEIPEADRLRVIQEIEEDDARLKKAKQREKVELSRSVPGPLKEAYEAFQETSMTVERAQELVPNAAGVWELVRERAEAKPGLQVKLAKEMARLNAPDAYSTYIFALARLEERRRAKASKKRIDEAAKLVDSLSAALEITPEKIVSMTTKPVEPEKPKAVKDTLKGTRQRRADVSRQEQRRKF